MSKIRILPDILANKIAAGEVVERPASVVKELVENALDAHSDRITIEIKNGGRSLIQVADNGCGMGTDDAMLALERFATSKLRSDADLAAIQTLGFRGEALPSIAAVSKLTLITREADAQVAVQVQIEGGKILQVIETGAPQGTLIKVAQLFFNTPARRKFLKSTATEMGHIADTVAGMALGYPQVHFKLSHNGKTVKLWSGVNDPAERVADVIGQVARKDLIAVTAQRNAHELSGFVAPARMARSTSRGSYFFVNGRRVRDRTIQHALFEGFHGRMMKGQYPLSALFLKLPFDEVDVNVHPTKHEVRFADQRGVHNLVQYAVAEALTHAEQRLWQVPDTPDDSHSEAGEQNLANQVGVREPAPDYAAEVPPQHTPPIQAPDIHVASVQDKSPSPALVQEPSAYHPPQRVSPFWGKAPSKKQRPEPSQVPLWQTRGFSDLTVIGQFRGTYIICQDGNDLVLIDQHAAHERIVFERLNREQGPVEAQQLMIPETIELSFAEAQMLAQLAPDLNAMGLEIEPFGGNTIVVKTIPTLLSDHNIEQLVRELAERSVEIGMGSGMTRILEACRMVMACHNAVRAKQHLTGEQIQAMLTQLDQCTNSAHCPHGRPTWIRWTLRDLEKAFGRTN